MMTLDSLKKYDGVTANNILAAIVLSSTTNPGVGEAVSATRAYKKEREEVLQELFSKLNISRTDQSQETNSKVLSVLTEQIHKISLGDKDSDSVLARAGMAGRLPPALYQIEFIDNFRTCVSLGTKLEHVRDAILRPNEVQHLPLADGRPAYSIFLRFREGSKAEDSFWLIVFAQRIGRTLVVQNAWRAYLSDVDLTNAKRPIDVLRAFAEKFGFVIEVGTQSGKFIANEDIPLPANEIIRAYTVRGVLNKAYFGTMSGHNTPGTHKVLVAYAINLLSYQQALKEHRVKTELKAVLSTKDEVSVFLSSFGDDAVGYKVI